MSYGGPPYGFQVPALLFHVVGLCAESAAAWHAHATHPPTCREAARTMTEAAESCE
jgi:hypothetical protein